MAIRGVGRLPSNYLCRGSDATERNPAQVGKRALSGQALKIFMRIPITGGFGESRIRQYRQSGFFGSGWHDPGAAGRAALRARITGGAG